MTKAIFWDNDGILVDTEALYFQATQHVVGTAGVALTESMYKDLFLVQGRGTWHLLAERGVTPEEVERLRRWRNELYGEWLARSPRLIDGIVEVLEGLHGRYLMGVVTSSRRDHFEVIHRQTGILKYFDFILTADDFSRVKPDPEPYVRAVTESGVERDACIAIEDSERGLRSARAAGVRCVVIPTALTRGAAFEGAYRVLESAREVPGVLGPAGAD